MQTKKEKKRKKEAKRMKYIEKKISALIVNKR
jgi:hypothetical protein